MGCSESLSCFLQYNIKALERLLQKHQRQWLSQQMTGTTKDDQNGNMLPNMDLASIEGGFRFQAHAVRTPLKIASSQCSINLSRLK